MLMHFVRFVENYAGPNITVQTNGPGKTFADIMHIPKSPVTQLFIERSKTSLITGADVIIEGVIPDEVGKTFAIKIDVLTRTTRTKYSLCFYDVEHRDLPQTPLTLAFSRQYYDYLVVMSILQHLDKSFKFEMPSYVKEIIT